MFAYLISNYFTMAIDLRISASARVLVSNSELKKIYNVYMYVS